MVFDAMCVFDDDGFDFDFLAVGLMQSRYVMKMGCLFEVPDLFCSYFLGSESVKDMVP